MYCYEASYHQRHLRIEFRSCLQTERERVIGSIYVSETTKPEIYYFIRELLRPKCGFIFILTQIIMFEQAIFIVLHVCFEEMLNAVLYIITEQ